jgi:hypothetical protein
MVASSAKRRGKGKSGLDASSTEERELLTTSGDRVPLDEVLSLTSDDVALHLLNLCSRTGNCYGRNRSCTESEEGESGTHSVERV